MMRKMALAGWLVCGLSGAALAQGVFDFDSIPGLPDEPTVQVDLNKALLTFASAAARVSDPAAAQMLEGIENIRVRVYEEVDNPAEVDAFMNDASRRLERDGWQRVVFVQEQDGEKVRVYAQMDGPNMNGVTIMVLDSQDAVFVNIAGRIDPETIGRIAGNLGFGDILGGFTGAPGFAVVPRTADE